MLRLAHRQECTAKLLEPGLHEGVALERGCSHQPAVGRGPNDGKNVVHDLGLT
jgi:hypothetical protein